jgi:hypothetical protein
MPFLQKSAFFAKIYIADDKRHCYWSQANSMKIINICVLNKNAQTTVFFAKRRFYIIKFLKSFLKRFNLRLKTILKAPKGSKKSVQWFGKVYWTVKVF